MQVCRDDGRKLTDSFQKPLSLMPSLSPSPPALHHPKMKIHHILRAPPHAGSYQAPLALHPNRLSACRGFHQAGDKSTTVGGPKDPEMEFLQAILFSIIPI